MGLRFVVLATLLVASSCHDSALDAKSPARRSEAPVIERPASDQDLVEHTYLATEIVESGVRYEPLSGESMPRVSFGERYALSDGCNGTIGWFVLDDGGKLRLTEESGSLLGCTGDRQAQAVRVGRVFKTGALVTIIDTEHLRLERDRLTMTLRRDDD